MRPILFFGCENSFYTPNELSKITAVDGNILKSMIGVPIQCHTTDLQRAFGMDTTDQYINFLRAKFIKRLLSNSLQREIIIYTLENNIKNSLTDKYFSQHDIPANERTSKRLIDLVNSEICKYNCLKKDRKHKKSIVNQTVESIKKLISEYETINFQEELFKLIKYDDTC